MLAGLKRYCRARVAAGSATIVKAIALLSVNTTAAPVPVPAAVWLMGTAVIGLVGISRRRLV